jgi:hypothetical protein
MARRDDELAAPPPALASTGVEFIAENGGGPGVRLRKAGRRLTPVSGEQAEQASAAALGKAETAVDAALADVEADKQEKAKRKRKLTTVPKELKPGTSPNKGRR